MSNKQRRKPVSCKSSTRWDSKLFHSFKVIFKRNLNLELLCNELSFSLTIASKAIVNNSSCFWLTLKNQRDFFDSVSIKSAETNALFYQNQCENNLTSSVFINVSRNNTKQCQVPILHTKCIQQSGRQGQKSTSGCSVASIAKI